MSFGNQLEHFSLRWNNFNNNLKTGFHDLLRTEDFVDVTIAAEGKLMQAHKIVLSVCSPYFRSIFKMNPCQHPVIFLKDVTHKELSAILQFMYLGEVSIQQEELARFLKTAEALQIKGLSQDENDEEDNNDSMITQHCSEICRHQIDGKTKHTNNDLIQDEMCFKKVKLSSINEIMGCNPERTQIDGAMQTILNNNESDMGCDDIENDVQCQDQNINFFSKTEPIDIEISDVESDRISLKDDVVSISDSTSLDNNKDDNHSLPESNSLAGHTQEISGGFQGLSNEPFTSTKGNEGFGYFPLLTKNQGRCPICGRILKHKKNLQTHIADQHSGMLRSWPCQICHKVCKTWSALRVHTNRHRTRGGCSYRGMNVLRSSSRGNMRGTHRLGPP